MTYLYRAIAVEYVDDAFTRELIAWPGMPLGRTSGYLSRSAAVNAGRASGVEHVIVRSEPVVFHNPPEAEAAELRADNQRLRERISVLAT
jgi:hypothetical protein